MFLAVLGEMGHGGVVGDHMVGKELRGVSIKSSTVIADMAQTL
jgi:hypothetical protein